MGATTSVSANRFRIAISPNSHTTSDAIVARDSPRDCPLESSLCSTFTRLRPLLNNVLTSFAISQVTTRITTAATTRVRIPATSKSSTLMTHLP